MTAHRDAAATQSARERLAQTRRELLRHMGQADARMHDPAPGPESGSDPGTQTTAQARADGAAPLPGNWSALRRSARAWWRAQPAHLALELGQPVFEKYASAHPLKLLALSAGTGAVLVLARPWRLISITGLLVAALKSTQLSALAADLLRPTEHERPPQRPPQRPRTD